MSKCLAVYTLARHETLEAREIVSHQEAVSSKQGGVNRLIHCPTDHLTGSRPMIERVPIISEPKISKGG